MIMVTALLTEIADYNEDGSWGRTSNGYPEIRNDKAHAMYVFANCAQTIPYGSYVFMGDSCLRVNSDYIDVLVQDFKNAGEPDEEESIRRRETTGELLKYGLRGKAPKWW